MRTSIHIGNEILNTHCIYLYTYYCNVYQCLYTQNNCSSHLYHNFKKTPLKKKQESSFVYQELNILTSFLVEFCTFVCLTLHLQGFGNLRGVFNIIKLSSCVHHAISPLTLPLLVMDCSQGPGIKTTVELEPSLLVSVNDTIFKSASQVWVFHSISPINNSGKRAWVLLTNIGGREGQSSSCRNSLG